MPLRVINRIKWTYSKPGELIKGLEWVVNYDSLETINRIIARWTIIMTKAISGP